jgi:HlyD family secretion protein
MDIARPKFRQQKGRRQISWSVVGLVCLTVGTVAVMRLKPAAPEVERSSVWADTVKRGWKISSTRGERGGSQFRDQLDRKFVGMTLNHPNQA